MSGPDSARKVLAAIAALVTVGGAIVTIYELTRPDPNAPTQPPRPRPPNGNLFG